jgi:hypothetical protein
MSGNGGFSIDLKSFIKKHYLLLVVSLVAVLALTLRYWHTKIGLPYLYYWDEPQTASTALKIMKSGDFNPQFFNYGSMMIYSNLLVDILHYLSLMGHAATEDSYLTNINQIKINADTGWHWTISHPSFYHWNRVLTTLLGTATVLVAYMIGKQVFNKWIGVIAAVFLAVLPYHISQSALITPDAPAAFFVLTVTLFSVLFINHKKLSYFILSLVFVGVAIATKYNSAITMILPLIALIIVYFRSRQSVKTYMWFLIPLLPVLIFLMIMPYAIIDMTSFLRDVGFEVRHYKVKGHGSKTSLPGWDFFSFQMRQFYAHLGLANILVMGLGLLGIFLRPMLIFVLIIPVIYVVYMSGMTVNFHRNFVQVYPFLALLFAAGFYVLYEVLLFLQRRFLPFKKRLPVATVVAVILSYLVPQSYTSIVDSVNKYNRNDSRTKVVNIINEMSGIKAVVIAKELRVHSQDLTRLKIPYSIRTLVEMQSVSWGESELYVLPSNVRAHHDRNKKKAEVLSQYISKIDKNSVVKNVGGRRLTNLDIYSVNPGVLLVRYLPLIPIPIDLNPTYIVGFNKCTLSKPYKGNPLRMVWNGTVTTPAYMLKQGEYSVVISARGTKAFDEYAKLKVRVFTIDSGKQMLLAEKIIETKHDYADYTLPFNVNENSNFSVELSFINDRGRAKPKEDRNAYLKPIIIKKR